MFVFIEVNRNRVPSDIVDSHERSNPNSSTVISVFIFRKMNVLLVSEDQFHHRLENSTRS